MRNFSRLLRRFVAENPALLLFLVGFSALLGAMASVSVALSAGVGGVILMTIGVITARAIGKH